MSFSTDLSLKFGGASDHHVPALWRAYEAARSQWVACVQAELVSAVTRDHQAVAKCEADLQSVPHNVLVHLGQGGFVGGAAREAHHQLCDGDGVSKRAVQGVHQTASDTEAAFTGAAYNPAVVSIVTQHNHGRDVRYTNRNYAMYITL